MSENSFFFTVSWEEARNFMKKCNKRNVPYYHLSEFGTVAVNASELKDCKVVVDTDLHECANCEHLLYFDSELNAIMHTPYCNEVKNCSCSNPKTKDKYCYIASIDFVDSSKDGVFVHLRRPNEKSRKLLGVKDVFKTVTITPNESDKETETKLKKVFK